MAGELVPPAAAGMGRAAEEAVRKAGLEVELVPCLGDNYCPVIHDPGSGATVIVDTPDARCIEEALRARGWTPTHILNTHHHWDHVGGNEALKQAFPELKIIGPRDRSPADHAERESIPCVDVEVAEGDTVRCGSLEAQVFEVGGHTFSHVAYFFPSIPMVLAGDCLFNMGCGRVFTGDFLLMQASLQKLRELPGETVVYCAHEYTEANVKFAVQVEPHNVALLERARHVAELRQAGQPTVPTLLGHEKATNPMLRWDAPGVTDLCKEEAADPGAVFTFVRKWKDSGSRPSAI